MHHNIEKEESNLQWELSLSQLGDLCIKANGETAILVDTDGRVTICQSGTKLGLTFRRQVE